MAAIRKRHQENRHEGKHHHPRWNLQQQVAQKHEQFAENQQRNEIQPEFAPQQSAQRNRRGLQNPERLSFEADRRKGKAHRRPH